MYQRSGLEGLAAFEALSHQVLAAEEFSHTAYPSLNRLMRAVAALREGALDRPSPIDLAILVRQVLRFQQETTGADAQLSVPVKDGWPSLNHWRLTGVHTQAGKDSVLLQATPWRPTWLQDVPDRGVDGHAAGEATRRTYDRVPGDPFLSLLHRDSYQTRGQRSAVRAAFMTPPGASLAITLPTGDGKSFVFQLLAALETDLGVPGVTLVVTPTSALAEDHAIAARDLGFGSHRLAYTSGVSAEERHQMLDRIRMGTQGLCFSSPEAVCTTLHPALLHAARVGFLRAIVIDEAHLVDAWGANFRASFQALSGVRAELIEASPSNRAPKTLLLSATMTTTTIETLRALFADGGDLGLNFLSAVQLRPEIEYWVSPEISGVVQRERVLETVLHMPRPAILYATEVEKAHKWYELLHGQGFRRIGLMTGKSSASDRHNVIHGWREGTLDLVVGTSAFGLGIDNPNVRCVVHACVPETLDRFYQEVGRGGRDGGGTASVIIPTERDVGIARSLNRPQLLTIERAINRWQSMINHKRSSYEGNNVFRLAVDVPPGVGNGRQDMGGDLNTEWHIRTLTLMANAKMIRLLGPDNETMKSIEETSGEEEELDEIGSNLFQQYQRVRLDDPMHPSIEHWQEVVSPLRERLVGSNRTNFQRMVQLLRGGNCIADLLAPIYEIEVNSHSYQTSHRAVHVATACAGCPDCRSAGRAKLTEHARNTAFAWPFEREIDNTARSVLGRGNRTVIFYSDEDMGDVRRTRRWIEALAKLVSCGVWNWIIPPDALITAADIQKVARAWPLFHSADLPPNSLPQGHTGVILGREALVTTLLLRVRPPGSSHFLFLHADAMDPDRPDRRLQDGFEGRKLDVAFFVGRMSQ